MRAMLEDNRILDPYFERGFRLQKATWIPVTGAVLDINMPPYIELNAAGAVNILMPTSSPAHAGKMFLLSNISAATVTLQTDGGAGFTTAIVLATTENTIVFCTGSPTQALGWRALGTALSS